MVDLTTKLVNVIGDKTAKPLEKAFGMRVVGDLLRHYPRRYAELGKLTDLSKLEVGQHVTIMARVASVKNYSFGPGGKRTRTEVVVTDGTGRLTLTFFQQAWRLKAMGDGSLGLAAGVVSQFNGKLQLTHPDWEPIDESADPTESSRLSRGIIPLYRATAKMPTWKIAQCVEMCLDAVGPMDDPLPEPIRAARGFYDMSGSFEAIHRPRSEKDWQVGRDRFRFEEAFVVQTVFAQRRHALEHERAVARPPVDGGLRDRFEHQLPFTLTGGQRTVVGEVSADLSRTHPMHRLLQGEVGSGKTIVALLAMLQVVDAGAQAALLAPTEVLASQHYRAITAMLGDLAKGGMLGGADVATRVRLLTGSLGAKARNASLLDAASGEAGIVIGTHALIQDHVQFAELGLLVVDEQHRFGVEQRAALVDRSEVKPHVLVMTATPIPRTIAMTVFGDLEVSTLRELPAGRQPIQTTVVPYLERPAWLERGWERVREEVGKGRQAYVVVSRIGDVDEDGTNETSSLVELHEELVGGPLHGLRVGALHGRMSPDDKDATMNAFAAGDLDVLVATTVVEVGVDVPNATVMVIMDADRFGVSQLHQLRGRVGRGSEAGLCLLVTGSDPDSPARERLDAVASTTDGFELSRLDAELRREGDVLGAAQSGVRSSLRLLSVVKDGAVIDEARAEADALVLADPSLADHPALAAAVDELEHSEQADYLERT
ncbi:ATP-dependent DNA helicase RecG [Aeromicrobium wangtongii]|uniref:Probable DNA 3'-5' helicase RecG n=1 Tax=Aeromicrobium wangtongii TaxID=2969247 RepID=A0ABY5MD00_9ACTN|nr:ATP-dependent DNA helicase RecG [Aeromicrobium wangtongii]MCD9197381.1 ATP-dependent DNA helicase RecG [Aeromicrobium wangtongii]UUP14875.1 ATP-dependent DNA helicase RecG [Aeromicrobium wangtongii]